MGRFELTFQSALPVTPARAWQWASSIEGVSAELWPILKMTHPARVAAMDERQVAVGQPLFRSWILLGGVLPIDRTDLTPIEIEPGHRFLERSPMLSMRLWQHERVIEPVGPGSSRLTDRLVFEPRVFGIAIAWFIERLFHHRHRVLRKRLK
jgi:hypothetical protein